MERFVDIATSIVSAERSDDLSTYSLGSGIGVAIWDPEVRVGGLLHYMLPVATMASDKAKSRPGMFASTGVPALFQDAFKLGAAKRRLVVSVAGGAQLLDDDGTFNIGRKNYAILCKLFEKNKVSINREDTGGNLSRSLRINIDTGIVTITPREGTVE